MPIFGRRFHPSSRCPQIRPKSDQSLAAIRCQNGAILKAHSLPGIFLQIRGHLGHRIAVCGGAILNPNRGRVCPILDVVSSPLPEALEFAISLTNQLPRLDIKWGHFDGPLVVQIFPRNLGKSRESYRRLVRPQCKPYSRQSMPRCGHHLQPSSGHPQFRLKSEQPLAVISL